MSDTNSGAPTVSAEGVKQSNTRRVYWIAVGLMFVVAVFTGLAFEPQIVLGLKRLVPEPNREREILYWQSPMDPNIHSDKPGKTPMGMDLVPIYADDVPASEPVTIAPELQESEFTIAEVTNGPLVRSLESVSTVAYAEPLIGDVTLKMEGWLEKLHVDYEGQRVHKGEPLFEVYAPKLFAAEEEFLINLAYAKNSKTSPNPSDIDNLESARQKLRYLDMTDQQIDKLASKGIVPKTVTFYSPFNGIVIRKDAFEGKAIPPGQLLYRIADLSKVWVNVYVYENQIHCVHVGQGATLELPGLSARTFPGKVIFVYPYLEPKSRTVKVRLEFDNPNTELMPDMFGRVKFEPHRMGTGLRIPNSSVLQTGKRNLVYVVRPGNDIEAREVRTGMELDGDMLEVIDGLTAGERIVGSPDFLLDSESRIRLTNRKFVPLPMPKHAGDHHEMPGMQMPEKPEPRPN